MIPGPACPPTAATEWPISRMPGSEGGANTQVYWIYDEQDGQSAGGTSGEPPAASQDARRPIRQLATLQVHLDLAIAQISANQLLGQRIFDVPLDRPPQ